MYENCSDYALVAEIESAARAESMAVARRMAAVAELYVRRQGALAELDWCITDYCDATAAEVSAALHISHARAVSMVQHSCALRHRLPTVLGVLLRGDVDYRVVSMILNRTDNVDPAALPALDEAIAAECGKWGRLSLAKLRDRVDEFVCEVDPDGQRVPPTVDESRYLEVVPGSVPGMSDVVGRLRATDGAALDQRLRAIAGTVCAQDPRGLSQRLADAAGALARGAETLTCQCGTEGCAAAEVRASARTAVIHVLAEQGTVDGTSNRPGYLRGMGVLPAESVRGLVEGAAVRPLEVPGAEAQYRPSAVLREFLRWRDVTCRWNGCDRPAAGCDVDHTVPYPHGPTHPSNNKHYCRTHHLIKTFLVALGWSERQLPDGTIEFTAPSGHTYRNAAHGAVLFPALARPTGEVNIAAEPTSAAPEKLAKMPRRTRTRAQNRAARIRAERRERAALNAEQRRLDTEERRRHEEWLAANADPPPF